MTESITKHPATVLVLGAGASKEFKLSTGGELFEHISRRLTGGEYGDFREQLKQAAPHLPFKDLHHALEGATEGSIDEFLVEADPEVSELVKVVASQVLLMEELLFWRSRVRDHRNSWYDRLWHAIRVDRLDVGVVTFNYDRTLELFLYRAQSSHLSRKKIARGLEHSPIEVVHVHGTLGESKAQGTWWHAPPDNISISNAQHAAKSIKLYYELVDEHSSSELARAREMIVNAKQLAFFGFGFHDQNVRRLGSLADSKLVKQPMATCFELPTERMEAAQRRFGKTFEWLSNQNCELAMRNVAEAAKSLG